MVRNCRDLIVWQKAVDLAVSVYKITRYFPKEELFGLVSQMRRCAVSVPSNIAEGQARNTTGEFKQFLGIAKGSLAELDTQLKIARRLTYLEEDVHKTHVDDCNEIGKMLNGLLKSLATNH